MHAWSRIACTAAVHTIAMAFILVPVGASFAASAAPSPSIGPVAPETRGLKITTPAMPPHTTSTPIPRKTLTVGPVAPESRRLKVRPAKPVTITLTPRPRKTVAQAVPSATPRAAAAAAASAAVVASPPAPQAHSLGSTTLTMSAADTPGTTETLTTLGPWLLIGTVLYALLLAARRSVLDRVVTPPTTPH